jgi:hypothetical protein
VTDSDWAGGTYATSYGFTVNNIGVKNDYFNLGNNAAAFGMVNDSVLTVMQILQSTNDQAVNGALFASGRTVNGTYYTSAQLKAKALIVFTSINETGDNT